MVLKVSSEILTALGPIERIFAEQRLKSGEWVLIERGDGESDPVISPEP